MKTKLLCNAFMLPDSLVGVFFVEVTCKVVNVDVYLLRITPRETLPSIHRWIGDGSEVADARTQECRAGESLAGGREESLAGGREASLDGGREQSARGFLL